MKDFCDTGMHRVQDDPFFSKAEFDDALLVRAIRTPAASLPIDRLIYPGARDVKATERDAHSELLSRRSG